MRIQHVSRLTWTWVPWALGSVVALTGEPAFSRQALDRAYQDLYQAARKNPSMTAAEFSKKRETTIVPEAQKLAKEQSQWVESTLKKNGIEKTTTPLSKEDADQVGDPDAGEDGPAEPEVLTEAELDKIPLFGGTTASKTVALPGQKPVKTTVKPGSAPPPPTKTTEPALQLEGDGVTILDFSK